MRKYLLFIVCAATALASMAQKMGVKAPARVNVGENFRLEYTVHNVNVDGKPQLGDLPEGLSLVYGPSVSQQESYSNVNGHVSSSSSTTFTFMLQAQKAGEYTIPPAKIRTGSGTMTADAVKVSAHGAAKASGGQTTFHVDDDHGVSMKSQGSAISQSDIFFQVSASKTHVFEQEPIVLTYKLCFLKESEPRACTGNAPDAKGFQVQEIERTDDYTIENINGRKYYTVVFRQYVLYPQMTGRLQIPDVDFKAEIPQRVYVDPMEAMLNGGSDFVIVPRNLVAKGLTIQVDSLPASPAGFSGAVGKFNISAQIDKQEVKAGDPINIRVVVGGVGNLKLLKQPVVDFPKDFDKYDAKVNDKTELTSNGVEGNMVYDYLAVPRNQGEFTIPPIKLSYFDTDSKSYKTVQTEAFQVKVLEGDGNSSGDDFADFTNKDIRPIKEGKASFHSDSEFFFASNAYWTWIGALLAGFIALLVAFRKRAIDNANITKMKGKKANKVANKRLKVANKMMRDGDNDKFYDEVLRALWGYVGDKLNMPAEQLSRDNITERLAERGVENAAIDKFIQALDECEYERYAPGDSKGNMSRTLDAAMTAIMNIEDNMKSNKKKTTSAAIVLLALLTMPLSAHALSKESADAAYKKGNYQQAIHEYEQLLEQQGVDASLYYNLGNAYYRTEDITRAILNYERAHMLSPGDEDIRFNLQLARSKTIDKVSTDTEMFFVTWYKALVNFTSVDRWAKFAIVCLVLMLALFLVYLFADRLALRKTGFYGAVAFLALFLLANLFAAQQKEKLQNRNGAIVMAPTVNVKKMPEENAENSFVLHEGTRVEITDRDIKGWRAVRLADGREGWMQDDKIEEI